MFFGEKLKSIRLSHTTKGLRTFSQQVDMKPSEYSKIERGIIPPPTSPEWMQKIIMALGIEENYMLRAELKKLMTQSFVKQKNTDEIEPLYVSPETKRQELKKWLNQQDE